MPTTSSHDDARSTARSTSTSHRVALPTGRPVVIDISIREENDAPVAAAPPRPRPRLSTEEMLANFRRCRSISASRTESEQIVEIIVDRTGDGSLRSDLAHDRRAESLG